MSLLRYYFLHAQMGGPTQKGINQYSPSPSLPPRASKLSTDASLAAAYTTAVVSPFRQQPMRGAFAHWAKNGYRRLAQQAVYFAVPLGLGTRRSFVSFHALLLVKTRLIVLCVRAHE